jgi:tetratricopeptide (TPR) repeat protein
MKDLSHEDALRDAKVHLGALLDEAPWLDGESPTVPDGVMEDVDEFFADCEKRGLASIVQTAFEDWHTAVGFALLDDPQVWAMARGQSASALRRLRRPDLAIRVCDVVLSLGGNYYAQATRGAALTDLGQYDEAIEYLTRATRPTRTQDGIERGLNALSRAHRLRGQQRRRQGAIGSQEDLEAAVTVARLSLGIVDNDYSRNTLAAAEAALHPPERHEGGGFDS